MPKTYYHKDDPRKPEGHKHTYEDEAELCLIISSELKGGDIIHMTQFENTKE